MMYNQQINTFIIVADTGSFTKAASISNTTTSALIKQINQLEYDLNFKLFNRTNHGVYLTSAGKSYYDNVKFITQFMDISVRKAYLISQEQSDKIIRIGLSPLTPIDWLAHIMNKNNNIFQEFKMNTIPIDNTMLTANIILNNLGNNIDCIVDVYDDRLIKDYNCQCLKLYDLPIRCAVSKNNSLYEYDCISECDLINQNIVLWDSNQSFDYLKNELLKINPNLNIVSYAELSVNMFNEAENNNYVVLTLDIWENINPFLKTIKMNWQYTVPYGLLYSNEATKKMVDFIERLSNVCVHE